ncbi:MAG TPA: acylneuraminate cytidylyltransferase family protein [Bacteroidales bacterium]|nr:MAG: CMP-N-acetylneuraminic acid synthetase [Bacteroidetes bacterium GWE2_42_24]OFY27515.1 MAG: CMP-N-acetylneuraminic acid synthetase [Bacteroidetes bacterium GWF2_43_11]PKP27835.1 MAG: acylneuraminate cytidylyltransferase family protein [Bacteroidetes bacterium HGW-Bacteroidetes-22]HAQ65681.1 acylneuraminate cytidylyltransferase family protein [Bacteroidales bacterium]HBZ66037.1 acylneuraminate cytidylyltransferase family protein [Bacteroidales bacterium]
MVHDTLFIIPARGGSKGIPGKNIRLFAGKPLLAYSIDLARAFVPDDNICLSTDSIDIARVATQMGLPVPFRRPEHLATDIASSRDVILHALSHYETLGKHFKRFVLLQPTSPLRQPFHIAEAMDLLKPSINGVMSVKSTNANPYFVLFEEDENGFLKKSKTGSFNRRQDCPDVWEANGAVYVYDTEWYKNTDGSNAKLVKYVMDERYSVDLDTETDWLFAEYMQQRLFNTGF